VQRAVILDPHVRMPHETAISYFDCRRSFHLCRGEHRAALEAGEMTIHHAQELARLPSATPADTVAALGYRLSMVNLLTRVGATSEAEGAACELRDALLDAASRFPDHPGTYELLATFSRTAPGAARDLGLARLAAERAVELSDNSDPTLLRALADVLETTGDSPGAPGLRLSAEPGLISTPEDAPQANR
jgi:hypothetical protein